MVNNQNSITREELLWEMITYHGWTVNKSGDMKKDEFVSLNLLDPHTNVRDLIRAIKFEGQHAVRSRKANE